jgi:hypothetical protein
MLLTGLSQGRPGGLGGSSEAVRLPSKFVLFAKFVGAPFDELAKTADAAGEFSLTPFQSRPARGEFGIAGSRLGLAPLNQPGKRIDSESTIAKDQVGSHVLFKQGFRLFARIKTQRLQVMVSADGPLPLDQQIPELDHAILGGELTLHTA